MCGRFSQTTPADILQLSLRFDDIEPEAAALLAEGGRYNICPTQDIVVVAASEGRRKAGLCRWGLVPPWAKDPAIGARMINARGETLADKPSFRRALVKRRCVVPADGFFEWRTEAGGGKTPMYIRRADGAPMVFAGLWERRTDRGTGDALRTATVVTGPPNGFMASIHRRMPAILDAEGVTARQGVSRAGGSAGCGSRWARTQAWAKWPRTEDARHRDCAGRSWGAADSSGRSSTACARVQSRAWRGRSAASWSQAAWDEGRANCGGERGTKPASRDMKASSACPPSRWTAVARSTRALGSVEMSADMSSLGRAGGRVRPSPRRRRW